MSLNANIFMIVTFFVLKDDEAVDPSFDLDSSLKSDVDHLEEHFCEEWVTHLEREDRLSLGLFLCFQLSKHFNLGRDKGC